MNNAQFEENMTKLEQAIVSLPVADRDTLLKMALETRERHASIQDTSQKNHEAAGRLGEQLDRLQEASETMLAQARRLETAVDDARLAARRLEDAVDDERLAAKYAEFDREASKRESALKNRTDEQDNQG